MVSRPLPRWASRGECSGLEAAIRVGIGCEDRHGLVHGGRQAADSGAKRGAGFVRALRVLTGEYVFAGFIVEAGMDVQAVARQVGERFCEEGGTHAVLARHALDDALQ